MRQIFGYKSADFTLNLRAYTGISSIISSVYVVLHVNGGSLARRQPHFPGTAFSCLRAYVRTPQSRVML